MSGADVATICRKIDTRMEPLEERLDKHDRALFGEDGRGGMVSEVAKLAVTVKIGVWLIGVFGTAIVGALVTMIVRGATLYVGQ